MSPPIPIPDHHPRWAARPLACAARARAVTADAGGVAASVVVSAAAAAAGGRRGPFPLCGALPSRPLCPPFFRRGRRPASRRGHTSARSRGWPSLLLLALFVFCAPWGRIGPQLRPNGPSVAGCRAPFGAVSGRISRPNGPKSPSRLGACRFCLCGSRFVGSALRPRPLCGFPPPLVSVGPPRLALSSARGAVRCSPSAVLRLVCSGLRGVAALPPLAPFAAASRLQVSFCLCALLIARRAASAGALLRPRCLGPTPFGSLFARLRSRCLGCSGPYARPRSLCSLRALLRAWLLAALPTALPSGVCLGSFACLGYIVLCGFAAAGHVCRRGGSCLSWRRCVLVSGVRVAWVVLVYVYMSRRSATARLRLRTPHTILIRFAPQNCARGLLLSQNSPAYIPKP